MTDRSLDTYGWNTAFVLRVKDANRLLAKPASPPKRYRSVADAQTAEWSFTPWMLAEASGSQVAIATQFAEGRLQYGGKTVDLAGLACTITCEMALKPVTRGRGDPSGTHKLDPAQTVARTWAEIDIRDDEGRLSFTDLTALLACLESWFRTAEALAEFDEHFAGLAVYTASAKDNPAWIVPRAVGFAGAIMVDGSPAIGILARTDDLNIVGCSYQLSPYAIPDGAQASFVISTETFLKHMLKPALPHTFGGAPGDYKIYDGNKIRNAAALELTFTTTDGRRFTGVIAPGKLDIVLSGPELVLTIHDLAIPVDLGPKKKVETIHIVAVHRLRLTLTSPDGKPAHKVLSLEHAGNPVVNLSTEESTGLVIAKIGVELATLIVASVAGYFAGRGLAARGISGIASKLLSGLLFIIIQAIGAGVGKVPDLLREIELNSLRDVPAFSAFLYLSLRHQLWPNPLEYEVTSAAFRDGVQIGVQLSTRTG